MMLPGPLAQETRLAENDSVIGKSVYQYDATRRGGGLFGPRCQPKIDLQFPGVLAAIEVAQPSRPVGLAPACPIPEKGLKG